MLRIRTFFVVALVVGASACDAASSSSRFVTPTSESLMESSLEALPGEWVHAFEEDSDGVSVYRPADSQEFPQARFRGTLTLEPNGSCERLVLDPADAHYEEACRWTLRASEPPELRVSNTNGAVATVRIVESTSEVLRLEAVSGGLHDERLPEPVSTPPGGGGGW
jgi:hypothetical protein